jgi:hypothetical protein
MVFALGEFAIEIKIERLTVDRRIGCDNLKCSGVGRGRQITKGWQPGVALQEELHLKVCQSRKDSFFAMAFFASATRFAIGPVVPKTSGDSGRACPERVRGKADPARATLSSSARLAGLST